jgi:glycosyltransferase involved in cell wall biosynthesis
MAPYLDEVDFIDMTGTADRVSLKQAGIRCHRPEDGGQSRLASLNLLRLLDRLAPDVIVCHYGSGDHFFNAIAWGRCPVAVIAMGNDVLYDDGDSRVTPMRALLTRMGLRRTAYISAKSQFIAGATRQLGYRGPMEVNYWGSSLRRFRPGDQAAARRELGLAEAGPLVLSPRAIEPRLNIHLVVEAFAEVVKRHPDGQLVILGRAMPEYRAQVLAAVGRLGLGSRVRVLDELSQEVLPAWYQASDVVVSVASVEGFPNTVLEVMACGVPVLVGDIPQIRELLTDGVNARICAVDAPAIAAGMISLIENPASTAVIANSGRETALESGDIDANGQRFASALRKAADGPAPGVLALLRFRAMLIICAVLKRWLPDVC